VINLIIITSTTAAEANSSIHRKLKYLAISRIIINHQTNLNFLKP